MATRQMRADRSPMFHFTNSSRIILVTGSSRRKAAVVLLCLNLERNVMNPANLPFDTEAMLQGLRGWVECESPTWDAGAVNRMLDIAAREMAIMGATIERIAGRQGFGGCVRAKFPTSQTRRAGHPDRGTSRHRAPGRHA